MDNKKPFKLLFLKGFIVNAGTGVYWIFNVNYWFNLTLWKLCFLHAPICAPNHILTLSCIRSTRWILVIKYQPNTWKLFLLEKCHFLISPRPDPTHPAPPNLAWWDPNLPCWLICSNDLGFWITKGLPPPQDWTILLCSTSRYKGMIVSIYNRFYIIVL